MFTIEELRDIQYNPSRSISIIYLDRTHLFKWCELAKAGEGTKRWRVRKPIPHPKATP